MFALSKLVTILLALLAAFLRLAITEVKTTQLPVNVGQEGNIFDRGNIITLFQNLKSNAAPVFGNWNLTEIAATLAADTYTGLAMVGGIIRRTSTGTTQDSSATATDIINAIPGAVVGQSFPCIIANMGSGTFTLGGNTGITLTGTATIARFQSRLFIGTVTGSAAVTINNCFAFGAAQTVG